MTTPHGRLNYRATLHLTGVGLPHHPEMFSNDLTLLRLATGAMLLMEPTAGPRILAIEIHDVSGKAAVLLNRIPSGKEKLHADA